MPRSIQLVGHRGGTERLLAVAATVERDLASAASAAASNDRR
jgi:hypothetical protein